MNIKKTGLSLAIMFAVASVQTTGFAKPKDDDSVYSWGPWATLVKPAAAAQVSTGTSTGDSLNPPTFGAGDSGQFTSTVLLPSDDGGGDPATTPSGRCGTGAACGYGLIQLLTLSSYIGPQDSDVSLPLIPFEANGEVNLGLTSNTDVPLEQTLIVPYIQTGVDPFRWTTERRRGGSGSWVTDEIIDGVAIRTVESIDAVTLDAGGTAFAYGDSSVKRFLSASNRLIDDSKGWFIFGTTTGLDDLGTLNAGNVQATYEGFTLKELSSVLINVDFGNQIWSGSWNGDVDTGAIIPDVDSNGVVNLIGRVGFEASGVISGANIVSNSISAADAITISGTVDGSFFGGDAGVLAGAVNIDKTTADYSGNYQDLYVTEKVIFDAE